MPEDGLIVPKPANLSFEEAASLSFGGTTALPLLTDKAGIKRATRFWLSAPPAAWARLQCRSPSTSAPRSPAVSSTANVDLVRSIGADRVIDYTQTDFAKTGETYDIILDTTGTAPYARVAEALKPGGRLVIVLGTFATVARLRPRAEVERQARDCRGRRDQAGAHADARVGWPPRASCAR